MYVAFILGKNVVKRTFPKTEGEPILKQRRRQDRQPSFLCLFLFVAEGQQEVPHMSLRHYTMNNKAYSSSEKTKRTVGQYVYFLFSHVRHMAAEVSPTKRKCMHLTPYPYVQKVQVLDFTVIPSSVAFLYGSTVVHTIIANCNP